MTYDNVVETAQPGLLAAVTATARIGDVGRAWKPALDRVWAFLRANPGLSPGHNVFLYHHPSRRGQPMRVDFGVQVSGRFEPAGNVRCVQTPAGEVARTVHIGPYEALSEAHAAVQAWCIANNRTIGRPRGRPTVIGPTIRLCSRPRSGTCWPELTAASRGGLPTRAPRLGGPDACSCRALVAPVLAA
jgi:hypothetical protein